MHAYVHRHLETQRVQVTGKQAARDRNTAFKVMA